MRTTRLAVAVVGTAVGLLLAGCSTGGAGGGSVEPTTAPEPENVLASVDPCTVLSPDELQQLGVTEPGEPVDQGIGEVGCDFDADGFAFAIYKGETDSIDYWHGQRDKFAIFEENKVGSRNGIKQVTKGAVGQSLCSQVIEVGSGSVSVQFGYDADKKQSDEATCAKAMEVAEVVEPKLPK
ncbi:DUF3558 family protein [Saccharopolyspora antimicrobica]|nr:DUF3558 family protein [Saccharopolyspora antimicrobica]